MTVSAAIHPRFKLPLHCVQLLLIHVVVILAAVRLFLPGRPSGGRNNTIALGMGAKSIIIILYQIGSEHWGPMKRWASLKAYAILNCLEIVFWAAVVFLTVQANIQRCVGTGCTLSWIIMAVGIVVTFLAVYAAIITVVDFRQSKNKDSRASRDSESSMVELRK